MFRVFAFSTLRVSNLQHFMPAVNKTFRFTLDTFKLLHGFFYLERYYPMRRLKRLMEH